MVPLTPTPLGRVTPALGPGFGRGRLASEPTPGGLEAHKDCELRGRPIASWM